MGRYVGKVTPLALIAVREALQAMHALDGDQKRQDMLK
jgi:hypothetical protein